MIHNLEISINIDVNHLNDEEYGEIIYNLLEHQKNGIMMDIVDIERIVPLNKLKFFASTIEMPELSHDVSFATTKIEIKG